MKKFIKYFTILIFSLFMVLTNFTPLNDFLPQHWPHLYCADKGKFCSLERAKGHNTFGSVILDFERYKKQTNNPNLVLHRRFYRKWWQIWNWANFILDPIWDVTYAERDEDT
jgi:hypothetical protein